MHSHNQIAATDRRIPGTYANDSNGTQQQEWLQIRLKGLIACEVVRTSAGG